MNAAFSTSQTTSLSPPALPYENQFQGWFPVSDSDLVANYIATVLWSHDSLPESWQVARLSPAVYVYREEKTGWMVAAKFYAPKTGKDAKHHAKREYQRTQQVWECSHHDQNARPVHPLGLFNDVIIFEYINGLTLEDKIAIRRNQPGALLRSLEMVSTFLAKLHIIGIKPKAPADFGPAADYAFKVIDNLSRHGVLQRHPDVKNGLVRLVEKWGQDEMLWNYLPAINHGDATTANFIFPPHEGVVSIDWERSELADPAADLGRLLAEVAHSINQNGGDFAEAQIFSQQCTEAYVSCLPPDWDSCALLHRAKFYQATSILRIARNGWLSRQDRLGLILEAFALLS